MGLKSFKTFQALLRQGHFPPRIGFKCSAGEINIFANRMRLARAFQGLQLDGYTEQSVLGYNGLFQVFLTHSALERFNNLYDLQVRDLETMLLPYQPENILQIFNQEDAKGRFYEFFYPLTNKTLKSRLTKLKNGESVNVAIYSEAIRHIFAHGHLTANANQVNPKRVHTICMSISDFLIEFMDAEFTKTIEGYIARKGLNILENKGD